MKILNTVELYDIHYEINSNIYHYNYYILLLTIIILIVYILI